MKILIVDDNAFDRKLLLNFIGPTGHDCLTAENGKQAFQRFVEEKPDMLILDVVMPDLSGFQVARKIRASLNGDWIPILFLTSKKSDEDIVEGIEAGADDFLIKPLTAVVIRAKIKAMMRILDSRRKLLGVMEKLATANRYLQHMSNLDGLTKITNRRCFDMTILREWDEAARHNRMISVIILDVDFFKAYNDHYGHQKGDECLINVAHTIKSCVHRPSDLASRYGGEEFAVILPETDITGAKTLSEEICQNIEQMKILHEKSSVSNFVTISAGCACAMANSQITHDLLIRLADNSLYESKIKGRNQVSCADLLQVSH